MSASVNHLQELRLLERNPGHGHPLRPEYRLTPVGRAVAVWAAELDSLLITPADNVLYRGKWALPVVSGLDPVQRYSEIKRALPALTDRALSICLTRLVDCQWVKRQVDSQSLPPAVSYHTLNKGAVVHEHLQLLPQW